MLFTRRVHEREGRDKRRQEGTGGRLTDTCAISLKRKKTVKSEEPRKNHCSLWGNKASSQSQCPKNERKRGKGVPTKKHAHHILAEISKRGRKGKPKKYTSAPQLHRRVRA